MGPYPVGAIAMLAFERGEPPRSSQLKNRMGIQHAFTRDPPLTGMLAARANKGIQQRLRQAVVKEAQLEALEAAKLEKKAIKRKP